MGTTVNNITPFIKEEDNSYASHGRYSVHSGLNKEGYSHSDYILSSNQAVRDKENVYRPSVSHFSHRTCFEISSQLASQFLQSINSFAKQSELILEKVPLETKLLQIKESISLIFYDCVNVVANQYLGQKKTLTSKNNQFADFFNRLLLEKLPIQVIDASTLLHSLATEVHAFHKDNGYTLSFGKLYIEDNELIMESNISTFNYTYSAEEKIDGLEITEGIRG